MEVDTPTDQTPQEKRDAVQTPQENGEAAPLPEKKPSRGRPKDENAPPKPKSAFQKVCGEARVRIKAEQPEVATDLKAMAMALKDAWDNTPQDVKDKMTAEYDEEMRIFKPKWQAYIQTDEYKKFFEVKQDWMDIKTKKKMIKLHVRGKMVVGTKLRVGGAFTVEFPENESQNYNLKPRQVGEVEEVKIDEEGNARINWEGLGSRVFRKKYFNKVEDPDIPKRPKSGYMIFAGEVRKQVQDEVMARGGGLSDVGKVVADKWAELTETRKAEYGEMAQKQKHRFDAEFGEYRLTQKYKNFEDKKVIVDTTQKLKKSQRVQFSIAPKRPLSAAAMFKADVTEKVLEEAKAENKTFERGEMATKLATMWKSLAPEEQNKYITKSAKLKTQWEAKYKHFKRTGNYLNFLETRQKLKIRMNRIVNLRDQPKKPKSVFAMYAAVHKSEVEPGKGEGKGVSALKAKFATAELEEKKKLEEQQAELLKKWAADLDEFKQGPKFKEFQTTEKKVKREFSNEALKVMTLKFLDAAPEQPPKSAFAIYVKDKRKRAEESREIGDGEEDDGDDQPANKKQKQDELLKFKTDWLKLDRDTKEEFDTKMKEETKVWTEQVKEFMEQPIWKEYLSEAKRLRIQVKHLLSDKKNVIKRLKNGMRVIPLPERPGNMPSKPPKAIKLFTVEKKKVTGDIEKILNMWKELGPEGRKPYEEEAQALHVQFEQDMKNFRQSEEGRTYLRKKTSAIKTKRIVTAKFQFLKEFPKKPPGALKVYMDKHAKALKKSNPELKGFEITRKLQEQWRAMEDERKPLEEEAARKWDEYQKAVEEFKAGENWASYNKVLARVNPKKPKAKARGSRGPPKPSSYPEKPGGAMNFFREETGDKYKDLASLHKAWQELDPEEIKKHEQEAREALLSYTEKVKEWEASPEGKQYMRAVVNHEKKAKLTSIRDRIVKLTPKRPSGAMQLFFEAKKEEAVMAEPDLKGPVLASKVNQMWLALDEDDKSEWHEKEKEALAAWEESKIKWESGPDYKRLKASEAKLLGKGGGGTRMPTAPPPPASLPKKPLAAFFLFQQHTGGGLKDVNQKWKEMGPDGQKEWAEKSKELDNQYQEDYTEFKASVEGKKYIRLLAAHEQKVKIIKAKERCLAGKDTPTEPKRPCTALFSFYAAKRKEHGLGIGSEDANKLNEMWKGLEPEEKKVWDDRAAEQQAEYKEAMSAYNNHSAIKALNKAIESIKGTNKKTVGKGATKATSAGGKDDSSSSSDSDEMGSDSDSGSSDSDSD